MKIALDSNVLVCSVDIANRSKQADAIDLVARFRTEIERPASVVDRFAKLWVGGWDESETSTDPKAALAAFAHAENIFMR